MASCIAHCITVEGYPITSAHNDASLLHDMEIRSNEAANARDTRSTRTARYGAIELTGLLRAASGTTSNIRIYLPSGWVRQSQDGEFSYLPAVFQARETYCTARFHGENRSYPDNHRLTDVLVRVRRVVKNRSVGHRRRCIRALQRRRSIFTGESND